MTGKRQFIGLDVLKWICVY